MTVVDSFARTYGDSKLLIAGQGVELLRIQQYLLG